VTKFEAQQFATRFLELFLANGFGSMTKRETELVVFHLLRDTREYRNKSNYEIASLLKIPESKVKALRLASALKYESLNKTAILSKIVLRLAENRQYVNFDKGKIEISLEDPIEKRELEQYLKSKGHHAEYTLNSEVLKIAPIRLLELIVENMERGEAEFDRLVRENLNDIETSARILDNALTLSQKFAQLKKELLSTSSLISLLSSAIGSFVTTMPLSIINKTED
jgi:DNA-binding CsgD family transcriptional regulator